MLSTSVKLVRLLRPVLLLLLLGPDMPGAAVGAGRWISRMFGAVAVMLSVGWSGGTKIPSCRKDLTFVMRISDDADGESRMIGFECRPVFGMSPADGAGLAGLGWGLRRRMVSAVLRICEKSYPVSQIHLPSRGGGKGGENTVGLIPRNTLFRSPIFRSPL